MRFGLLGGNLAHSYSPQIHTLLGDYEYLLFEKESSEVGEFLQSGAFDGLNVTIPHKQTVMPFLTEISPTALKIGAVNTITRLSNGELYGDNSDYFGFSYLLDRAGFAVKGKKVLVLGSGGASKTAVCVCRDRFAQSVTVISRRGKDSYENLSKHSDADFIVNATPVGMYPKNGESPVDLSIFKGLSGVADMIYNPSKTKLLLDAEKMGIAFTNGLPMLCAQAAMSCESFTGRHFSQEKIEAVNASLERSMLNIALVGMPGCGKSTVGALLAKKLGRSFSDSDLLIEEKFGKAIPTIFEQMGEAAFRNAEAEVLSLVCRQSGTVIATGGGAVLRSENIDALRENSVVVFLKRDVSSLETIGRPLSTCDGLAKMLKERLPFYEAAADFSVSVLPDAADTAKEVLKGLEKYENSCH